MPETQLASDAEGRLHAARSLLVAGEYVQALAALREARELAVQGRDAKRLFEVRRLARQVWREAPRGSGETEAADRLYGDVGADFDWLGLAQPQLPWDPRMSFAASVLGVLVGLGVLAGLAFFAWVAWVSTHGY